jgi:hypothetical protein
MLLVVRTGFALPSISTVVVVIEVIAEPKGKAQESNDEAQTETVHTLTKKAMQGILGTVHIPIGSHQQVLSRTMVVIVIRRIHNGRVRFHDD